MRKRILVILAMSVLTTSLMAGCAKQKGSARVVSERPGQETTRLYNHEDDEDEEDETETVEETSEDTSEKETEKKESKDEKNVITNDTVNVRKKPSTDSKVVKTLDAGVKLHRESKKGKWSVVIVDGKKRYVASEYLDEIKDNVNSGNKNKTDDSKEKNTVSSYLDKAGYTTDYFKGTGCRQLVVVDSKNSGATLHFFSKKKNEWVENEELECAGYVGSEGSISPYEMSEEHRATPRGLYGIGQAFYISDKPETKLAMFKITDKTYWVDDPDSAYYNQKVEGTENKDWDSAEHMADATEEYKYGFVIQYNTAGEYDKGSAIFFHISSGPTAGCVGTTESMVLKYLKKLDQTKSPLILVL
ncbi:MAG: SH3 domain-containing protein [Lachnospiraceae bacterium]|nr:SH3 domain-containing protein [Lachnospiraceae bacterium]